ncbi:hypothetical protein BWQ96_03366 [Gracilariopsis chorda]|uniref:Metallo-beta-lactamase domain-containing protein n=1 Tax=Gracilariopsis chorda TaxID=448386 RepID=A0A2V3IYS5_9FLOR|nr:hypothetical protein BWQ96_03366 [Gracilariopsis chorda]|eukprot:PXF46837.1 hypothetical protein BWQ96_03366 [Gracilariopsis chorda]
MAKTITVSALLSLVLVLLFVHHTSATATNRTDLCPAVAECIEKLDDGQQCDVLPVPPASLIPQISPGPFRLTLLRSGVWSYEDGAYVSLILYRKGRLALLDFPDSPNSNTPTGSMTRLTDAAMQVLNGSIPHRIDMVYSHDHYDHIGAATRFFRFARSTFPRAKILIWGTTETKRAIRESESKRAVVPNIIVYKRGRTLSLGGGLRVRMTIAGGHSGKDLILYIPPYRGQKGIVMHVDVVYPGWVPFTSLGITEDVNAYLGVHEKILRLNFDIFIAGHVLIGTEEDVRRNQAYTRNLLEAGAVGARTASLEDFAKLGFGRVGDPNAREFGNLWFAFIRVVRKAQVDICSRIMIEKWGCRLAGLDVMIESHCFTAVTHTLLSA